MTPASRGARRLGWAEFISRGGPPARIMVVDDDPQVRKNVAALLVAAGYSAHGAGSAEEADRWLGQADFDVCLLDIGLPRMSGVEFLTWLKARDPELAVIMLTGMDAPELALRCIDEGARTFLVKPVDREFLLRAVRDAVAVRRLLDDYNDRYAGLAEEG